MKLRKYLAFMLAGAAMMFAVSCSDDDDPDPGPTPEPSPSPTYKPSLYYLGIDTAAITEKYPDMTGQMLEVRYYLNTNMNKDVQLTLDEIGYYYCYFERGEGGKVIPNSAQGNRKVKEGKDLVSHKGHEAMFGDYKMPNLENILSLGEAIKIVKDAAAAPGAAFKCPRTGVITLHRPVDPTSAGKLYYTFGDDASNKYNVAVNAYTGELELRDKPDDPSPDYKASIYWLNQDTAAINKAQPAFEEHFKSAVYTLNSNINEKNTPDELWMTQIDYNYSKGEGSNADLCKGKRTQFYEGAPMAISTSQGEAIDYLSFPYRVATTHDIRDILERLFDAAEKPGAQFELPATNKIELYVSHYEKTLGECIYDFGLDGSGQHIIVINFHSGNLYLEEPEE